MVVILSVSDPSFENTILNDVKDYHLWGTMGFLLLRVWLITNDIIS